MSTNSAAVAKGEKSFSFSKKDQLIQRAKKILYQHQLMKNPNENEAPWD